MKYLRLNWSGQEIMSKPDYLLWCDLETTGLDPENESILEIALVLTTPELASIDWKHFIIIPEAIFVPTIKENVRKMHTDNGLWLDVINKGTSLGMVDLAITDWLDKILKNPTTVTQYVPRDWSKVYLAGSSVHFDRKFLIKYGFTFEKLISYRHVDVSVIRTLLKMWNPEDLWEQNTTHRAVDDIFDHIEELKYYRNILGLWNPITPESKKV